MNFAARILSWAGWHVSVAVPDYPKCIICVAPHTSNWDFVLGMLAYASVGRKAGFLMKSSWFFWPLGPMLKALGGVPVDRSGRSGSLVEAMVRKFRHADSLQVAITPEGTRSRTERWHTGFLRIAAEAGVPVILGAIDARTRNIYVDREFQPTGNIDADLRDIKAYYRQFQGIHPEKFCAD